MVEVREALEAAGFLPAVDLVEEREVQIDHDLVVHVGMWRDEQRGTTSQQASA